MGDKNSLSLSNIEKLEAFFGKEKDGFEVEKNQFEQKEKKENVAENSEKTLPREKQENILSDTLVGVSNQHRFQQAKQKEIEKVLQTGLEDIYLKLPPEKQIEFKLEGEKTTREISSLLDKTKVNVGKIVSLIRRWLSLIPGVNRFFLEQEAKIKADEIVKLRDN
jgi:hypothetical protein